MMKIRCINDDKHVSIIKGKVYEVISSVPGFYSIIDESGDEYGFPAELFEVVED